MNIARENGFKDGVGSVDVSVFIPPRPGGLYQGEGLIEVQIANKRPSIFASLAGIFDWDISARAVALNDDSSGGDFALLALDDQVKDCSTIKVNGTNGVDVIAYGHIRVDSPCPVGALTAGGSGEVSIVADGYRCLLVGPDGAIDTDGANAIVDCEASYDVRPYGDPLASIPQPWESPDALPEIAEPPVFLSGDGGNKEDVIPDGCPGADKAPTSWDDPHECNFQGNTYDGTTWRLSPGAYPGGLDLSNGTFHLRPGIYYIFGGGLTVGSGGGSTAFSVNDDGSFDKDDAGNDVAAGGVLFFNTAHPDGKPAWEKITMNGGDANMELLPLGVPEGSADDMYNGILIWNDRNHPVPKAGVSVEINGGDSDLAARGTIYSPSGTVDIRGNSATAVVTIDQAIAWQFALGGNGGSIVALDDQNFEARLIGAGLVE